MNPGVAAVYHQQLVREIEEQKLYNERSRQIRKNGLETGEWYDDEGYDEDGYNRKGYDREGYDREGYNRKGFDRDGYDRNGIDEYGLDRRFVYFGRDD